MMTLATPDYLRFGPINALRLFHAMTRFPAVERLLAMQVPTLAVLGQRDPLLPKQSRIDEVTAMSSGTTSVVRLHRAAHAINYSHPQPLAEAVRRFVLDVPLVGIDGMDVLKQVGGLSGSGARHSVAVSPKGRHAWHSRWCRRVPSMQAPEL
jgi:hypothetical protein